MLVRKKTNVILSNREIMEKATIIRHEEKNQLGRTLFAIDAIINKEWYLWDEEDCCFYPNSMFFDKEQKETNELIDGEYFFFTPNIVIHLPLRLEDKNAAIKAKKEEVFDYISCNPNNQEGIMLHLKALAQEILRVPNVEKLFIPDFALNEYGDYDAAQMVRELEQADDSYKPVNYKSVLTDYVELIFEQLIEEEIIIDKASNPVFFEWLQFYLLFENKQFTMKDIPLNIFIANAAQNEMIDYLLELALQDVRMIHVLEEDEDENEEEQLFLILDKNDQHLGYFIHKRAA